MEHLNSTIANRATAVAVGSVLILSACTNGAPETAPQQGAPQLPVVERDATPPSPNYSSPIDIRSIDQSIAAFYKEKESPYKILEQTHPDTGLPTDAFPLLAKTAPALTISLHGDKLQYEDSTPGLIPAERQILGAVNTHSAILKGAMKSNRVHKVNFRVFESKEKTHITESAEPMFLLKDATDDRKNNLYYFLPVDKPIEEKTIATMLGHESMHAALNHVTEQVTPERRRILEKACATLKQSAQEDIKIFGTLVQRDLADLWRGAPTELKPHYLKVIEATKKSTYDQLPVLRKELNTVPACFTDRPTLLPSLPNSRANWTY